MPPLIRKSRWRKRSPEIRPEPIPITLSIPNFTCQSIAHKRPFSGGPGSLYILGLGRNHDHYTAGRGKHSPFSKSPHRESDEFT